MSEKALMWFAAIVAAGLITAIAFGVKFNNDKSWAQTESCNKKGGVMMAGTFNGCVRISPVSGE